jgi:hypothetical protein
MKLNRVRPGDRMADGRGWHWDRDPWRQGPRSNEANDRRRICHNADTPFADLLLPRNSAFPVKAAVFRRPGLVGYARVGCSSGRPATGPAAVQ